MSEFKFSREQVAIAEGAKPQERQLAKFVYAHRSSNSIKRLWDKIVLEVYSFFFIFCLTLYYSLTLRRKMSHNNGVLLGGELEIVGKQKFPAHAFFEPGKKFDCRVRHAAAGFMDDAMLCVRSMSVKFSDSSAKSPLDIEMNTGRSLFWSVRNFLEFARWKRANKGVAYQKYWLKYPAGQQAAQDSVTSRTKSYSKLAYYSQTPTRFIGDDGKTRYARYRCVPYDNKVESQRNSVAEIGYFWGDQRVEPGDEKHRNYLKDEMKDRIRKQGKVEYRLQIQTVEASAAERNPAIFNSNLHWDEDVIPWHDLAKISVDKTLSYKESVLTYFSHAHCPESLGIIPAYSVDDYNSLNHMRLRSDFAKKARMLGIKLFGMPKPLEDDGPRNVDERTCERKGSIPL